MVICLFICLLCQDGDEVDELEKEMEIQSSIIEASKVRPTLLFLLLLLLLLSSSSSLSI